MSKFVDCEPSTINSFEFVDLFDKWEKSVMNLICIYPPIYDLKSKIDPDKAMQNIPLRFLYAKNIDIEKVAWFII